MPKCFLVSGVFLQVVITEVVIVASLYRHVKTSALCGPFYIQYCRICLQYMILYLSHTELNVVITNFHCCKPLGTTGISFQIWRSLADISKTSWRHLQDHLLPQGNASVERLSHWCIIRKTLYKSCQVFYSFSLQSYSYKPKKYSVLLEYQRACKILKWLNFTHLTTTIYTKWNRKAWIKELNGSRTKVVHVRW